MANGTDETKPAADNSWMGDVQRAIAMILIGSLAIVCVFLTLRLIFFAEADALLDMAKTLQAALVNMALIALGFFFGSNKASKDKDETISKIAMTPAPNSGAMTPENMAAAATAAAVPAAIAAAKAVAPAAAEAAAPAAAEIAAPPVVDAIVPPAVEKAVEAAFEKQNEKEKDQ